MEGYSLTPILMAMILNRPSPNFIRAALLTPPTKYPPLLWEEVGCKSYSF